MPSRTWYEAKENIQNHKSKMSHYQGSGSVDSRDMRRYKDRLNGKFDRSESLTQQRHNDG
jgi:hypothetical protein